MDIVYAWDEDKLALVNTKHGVTFGEVVDIFDDPDRLDDLDPQGHASRLMVIGRTLAGRILQVIFEDGQEFTEDGAPIVRLITAFDAENHWREEYERSH